MNSHIKKALLNGRLILLLGAGASKGCQNNLGRDIPLGQDLAEILAIEMGEEYHDEALSDVYAAAKDTLGSQIDTLFEKYFKHCKPSREYIELLKYPFPRIYTLNIDDAFEKAAYQQNGDREFNVRQRYDCISEVDQFYKTLDYIKLNGDIGRARKGFIFSDQEYGLGSAKTPLWYEELASDYHKYTFIFIGTRLKEPLFYHQIERYKAKTNSSDLKSYILIPSLGSIEKKSLEARKIHHLEGTLASFVEWLKDEFNTPPTSNDIVRNTRPELTLKSKDDSPYLLAFTGVTPVNRTSLALIKKEISNSRIRNFYKGFKPTWFDIVDEVPAFLKNTRIFFEESLKENKPEPLDLYLLFGAAGSGKTTALMQLALKISDEGDRNVFYIEEHKDKFLKLIQELDQRNTEPYYVFIERVGDVAPQIADIIKSGKSKKVIFVSAENSKIWKTRVKPHLEECLSSSRDISQISRPDADLILRNLELFGNWTRLSKMSLKNRKIELFKKSRKQLLIGLIEATSGEGYKKIIERDYKKIECESEKSLLILSGLAATQRVPANEATLTRALSYLGLNSDVHYLASQMDGILSFINGNVLTRHRVYIEHLFNSFIPQDKLLKILCAYIKSFAVYKHPIVKSISRNEFAIYKHLVNAKSLKRLFNNNVSNVLLVYETFEKSFENEGLFLLQYGLALRSFDKNEQAFEKLIIAQQAFPESVHIEHALAQQRIILACKENSEVIAMNHFCEAESVLNRLNSSDLSAFDLSAFDQYPIITLSEGHVKIFNNLGKIEQARILAKQYYDTINRNPKIKHNDRVIQTLEVLERYYLTGRLIENDS